MTRTCHLKCDVCPALFGAPLDGVPGYTSEDALLSDAAAAGWRASGQWHACVKCADSLPTHTAPWAGKCSGRVVESAPPSGLDWGAS